MKKKKKSISAIIIASIIIVISFSIFAAYKMSINNVEGWSSIEKKEVIGGDYFFFVERKGNLTRIECNAEQYGDIIIESHTLYHIRYQYSTYKPTTGRLEFIITDSPFYEGDANNSLNNS